MPPQAKSIFAGVADVFAFAYGINPEVPALQADFAGGPIGPGTVTVTLAFGTVTLADGTVISPLATNAPITIGSGANAETVTPTAVSVGTPGVYQSASFTATLANSHGTGDRVTSGSFGVAEAVNYQFGKGGGAVMIDRDFINAGGAVSNVTATHGYLAVPIVQNIGTASAAAFSYHSTGTSGSPAAYVISAVSWY